MQVEKSRSSGETAVTISPARTIHKERLAQQEISIKQIY